MRDIGVWATSGPITPRLYLIIMKSNLQHDRMIANCIGTVYLS